MKYTLLRNHFINTIKHYKEFEMYYLDGYSFKEIALVFLTTPRTIQRRVNNVKKLLQKILIDIVLE